MREKREKKKPICVYVFIFILYNYTNINLISIQVSHILFAYQPALVGTRTDKYPLKYRMGYINRDT